ncbi:MAG: hypothetical protein U1C18_01780 [Patescibacteria group bacterium]|nr:hypothetical protein [Patescibacteria group bacterium]
MVRWKLVAAISIMPLLGAGCTESIATAAKDASEWAVNTGGRIIRESGGGYVRNITDEQKTAIDAWLAANDLNRYGDPKGTFYAGGTPLFNESTGETTDRFEHLFAKFPELKDIIKQQMEKSESE